MYLGKKLSRFFIALFGVFLGMSLIWLVYDRPEALGVADILASLSDWVKVLIYIILGIIFGIVFYLIAPALTRSFVKLVRGAERRMNELSMQEIFVGVVGLLFGLVIAALLSILVERIGIPVLVVIIDVILFGTLAILGWRIPTKRIKEINLPNWFRRGDKHSKTPSARPKILDTSAIIDGRFFDVCSTGIVDGTIIVPCFVLDELRHIADSPDPLKRARGRRGLDALNKLQAEPSSCFHTDERDYPDLAEVDTKLLRLAIETSGIVVTNDYNLGKVAAVQGVPVFNINDMANALRINVVTGELIDVAIIKEGKEATQGIAYFDDGTMIVVDGARKYVGETVTAIVTSVLQTSAGKMVFAKLDE